MKASWIYSSYIFFLLQFLLFRLLTVLFFSCCFLDCEFSNVKVAGIYQKDCLWMRKKPHPKVPCATCVCTLKNPRQWNNVVQAKFSRNSTNELFLYPIQGSFRILSIKFPDIPGLFPDQNMVFQTNK